MDREEENATTAQPAEKFENMEDVIEHVDARGRWQYWTMIKCGVVTTCVSVVMYAQYLAYAGKMNYSCALYEDGTVGGDNNTLSCAKPSATAGGADVRCVRWNYSSPYYESTVINEYDMVCDRLYLMPTYLSSIFIGQVVGNALSGFFADRYGRRVVLWVSFVLTLGTALAMSFIRPLWLIIAMRIVIGTFGTATWNAAFVISVEVAVPSRRKTTSTMAAIFWPIGAALSCLVTYFINDWRQLGIVLVTGTAVIGLPFALSVPESPRWLVLQQKFDQAKKVLSDVANSNRTSALPLPRGTQFLQKIYARHVEEQQAGQEEGVSSPLRQLGRLLADRRLRWRSLMLSTSWMSVAFVFFGIIYYGSGSLQGGSPILLLGLMSLGRVCAYPFYVIFFKKYGCRATILGALPAISAGLLVLGLVPLQQSKIGAVIFSVIYIVAHILSDASFLGVYIITGELYPTVLRQTSLGFFSLIGRAGSFSSTYVASMLTELWPPLPAVIFAAVAACSALTVWALPQAQLDASLPETVKDARNIDKLSLRRRLTGGSSSSSRLRNEIEEEGSGGGIVKQYLTRNDLIVVAAQKPSTPTMTINKS